jgi:hypothetical protein
MAWNFEDNSLDPRDIKIFKFLKAHTNATLAKNLSALLSLGKYLDTHQFGTAERLRENVRYLGKPMFTKLESEELFEKHALQHGGSIMFDRIVESLLSSVDSVTPEFIRDTIFSLQQIATDPSNLIEDPELRELVGILMLLFGDVAKNLSVGIQNASGIAGPPGQIVGYIFASCLNAFAILSEANQGNKGRAFINALPLVPLFGTMLYTSALSLDRRLQQIEDNQEYFLGKVATLWGPEAAELSRGIIDDILMGVNPLESGVKDRLVNMAKTTAETYVDNAIDTGLQKVIGGKRLSSQMYSKSKWRTQRRLRR